MANQEVCPGLSQPAGDSHLSLRTQDATEAKLMAIRKTGSSPADSNHLTSKPQEHTRGNICVWLKFPW